MKSLVVVVALAGLSMAAASVSAAGEPAAGGAFATTTLSLSAVGEAHARPDLATLSLGVETTRATAGGAMRDNAAQMTRVITALKASGLADRDLRTSNLSLNPQYVYEPNQPSRLSGYQASNQVQATVRDLSKLGPVADAVVAAGANSVGQISFGLSDPLAAENSARLAAVKALQDKAALYAQATGYHIVRLVSLSEGAPYTPGPQPMGMMAAQARVASPTPVEAGESTVRVDVTGLFELAR